MNIFGPLTGNVELEVDLVIGAIVQHFAAKRDILVLAGGEEGQITYSHVGAIWSQFTFNLGGRLDHLPISGPGEGNRRRVETVCIAVQLALCL